LGGGDGFGFTEVLGTKQEGTAEVRGFDTVEVAED
jgi:hypothetical protein